MKVVLPNELEAGAVIPQCLDNQYVTTEALSALIDHSLTYDDEQVTTLRSKPVRNEFIRSLIYTPQVVVNRAYFKNNKFLYANYHPRNELELVSFVELMKQEAILAFLGTETLLIDEVAFDTTSEGDLACQALVDRLGDDYTAVKFSKDDVENGRMLQQLGRRFANYFVGLNNVDYASRMEMASELFSNQELLQDESVEDVFHELIDQLANYAVEHAQGYQKAERKRAKDSGNPAPRPLSRNEIYKRFFMDDVANGRFLDLRTNSRHPGFELPLDVILTADGR